MFASAAVFFGKKEIKKVVISEVLLLLFPLHFGSEQPLSLMEWLMRDSL